jgi:predicted nuclease of predicted toxin-antitoxin system
MRFKLDENFGTRTQHIFETSGHDAQTVRQEALQGSSDIKLFDVCVREQRCLVTLDLDFADVTRFRSVRTAGIVVIRAPRNPSLSLLESLVRQFLTALERMPIGGDLWIVEIGRIRVHQHKVNGYDEDND